MNILKTFFRAHKRLAIAAATGAFSVLLTSPALGTVTRALIGWNVAVGLYLVLVWALMTRADHRRIRLLSQLQDETAVVVLVMISIAAIMSLAAIVLELHSTRDLAPAERLLHYALTGGTVVGSWLLVATVFTLHYAHMFYSSSEDPRPLQFPEGEPTPDYWDFAYFAFTIAVASQTADVSLHSHSMRKTVLAQSVLSFLFNASVLGLSVNIAASLVSS